MAKQCLSRENGYTTFMDLLIIVITIGLVTAVMMFFIMKPSYFDVPFQKFEQWSISHPYEAEHFRNNPVSYQDFVQTVTGETVGNNKKDKIVTYIEKDNGNYEFCIDSDNRYDSKFRWSSETQKSVRDPTCSNQ